MQSVGEKNIREFYRQRLKDLRFREFRERMTEEHNFFLLNVNFFSFKRKLS